jgi:hypothetical protein
MPQADSAVEAAIFTFGGMLFSRLINPIIIIWVAVAIALFLYIIFKSFWDRNTSPGREDSRQGFPRCVRRHHQVHHHPVRPGHDPES